jgi:acyl-CoA thioester hydrolase
VGCTYRDLEAAGFMLPVTEAHCEFRQPARYDDELAILTRGQLMSPVRVRFAYEVRRTGERAVTATGHTVHASVDAGGKPARLPLDLRKLLA